VWRGQKVKVFASFFKKEVGVGEAHDFDLKIDFRDKQLRKLTPRFFMLK